VIFRLSFYLLIIALVFKSIPVRADENPFTAPHHNHHKRHISPGPSEIVTGHSSVEKKGVFTFEQESLIATYPYPKGHDDIPDAPATVKVNIAYPRIISSVKNGDIDAWNRVHYRLAPATADCNENDTYSIGYVTTDFISIERMDGSACPGAAHGWGNIYMDNRLISERRQLAPCDIFDHGKPWEDALRDLALAKLEEVSDVQPDEGFLRRSVTNTNAWGFEQQGLIIQFDLNLYGYAGGAPRVTIPWDKLKPYLAAHPAFTLPFEKND
jgi:hypothetical protein